MSKKRESLQSNYDLFRGKLVFTNEPPWLRLTLSALVLAGALILVALLHRHTLSAVGIRWLSSLISKIRSP